MTMLFILATQYLSGWDELLSFQVQVMYRVSSLIYQNRFYSLIFKYIRMCLRKRTCNSSRISLMRRIFCKQAMLRWVEFFCYIAYHCLKSAVTERDTYCKAEDFFLFVCFYKDFPSPLLPVRKQSAQRTNKLDGNKSLVYYKNKLKKSKRQEIIKTNTWLTRVKKKKSPNKWTH